MLLLSLPQAKFPAFILSGAGRYLHVAFAIAALCAGWCVMVLAQQRGGFFVFSMLALVAAADVFAYFAGKAYGKHKLAPNISPGKTREGAIGGLIGAVVLALAFSLWSLTYFYALGHGALLKVALLALLFAAVSIAGDLFESLLKRQAGAKDSSTLLPGHGGVLDRIDAMIPVLPLMWMTL
jgi:phosphatidate cytidylyltransferase